MMITMKALILCGVLSIPLLSTTLAQLSSEDVSRSPRVPLRLYRHLRAQEVSRNSVQRLSNPNEETKGDQQQVVLGMKPSARTFAAHSFEQLVNHLEEANPASNNEPKTFKQRYWFNAEHYQPGGPIFLLDGGETSGQDRIPFLENGILEILSKAHHGIGVILEHRYYGESFPVKNLTTDSLRFLTTEMSLLDSRYFAQNVRLPLSSGIKQAGTEDSPWIYYGGSYAGAKSAFARLLYPDVFWGAIASSAVTRAIIEFDEYYEPIRKSAPSECIQALINHTKLIDSLLDLENTFVTTSLKSFFGLPNVTRDVDFVNALSMPLGSWQARIWDPEVGSREFDKFCEALSTHSSVSSSSFRDARLLEDFQTTLQSTWPSLPPTTSFSSLSRYAEYTRTSIAALCPTDEGLTQDECFGSEDQLDEDGKDGREIGLDQSSWRSWTWQVCNEWGYFAVASPNEKKRLISKRIDLNYTSSICRQAFNPSVIPETPNVTAINRWGGFGLEYPRLAFIDGSEDPWLYATPHSPHAKARKDTLKKPFKLIKGGVHHWDENGLKQNGGREPKQIRNIHAEEIEFVGAWLQEWKDRGKWRPENPNIRRLISL